MALDPTVGGANANSYVSLAEANAYMLTRTNSSAWSALGVSPVGDPEREALLITATSRIDVERFREMRTASTQRLQWPRYGLWDEDGYLIPSDTIPRFIKEAVYEMAMAILGAGTTDLMAPTGLEGYDEVTVGPLRVVINHEFVAGELPSTVDRLLARYRAGGGNNFRIQR